MAMQKQVQIIHASQATPDILRVAAYVRVSSLSDDQLHSFHLQYNHYHSFVSRMDGWQLVDVYADEGLTGTRADQRQDFNRLMRDCRAGKIDRIITKSVSRFARNVEDCLRSVRELKALGITVFFEEDLLDTADMPDEVFLAIRGVQAQQESILNSRNASWSYQERMRNGTFITYHAPIGYKRNGSKLVVDEETAPIVRRIFAAYLSGMGRQAIADILNQEGIRTSEGGAWSANAIGYVLKNEKYIGDALLQKKYTTDTLPFTKKMNRGERPQYYVEAAHEPIISKAQFYRVQELFQWRNRFTPDSERNSYPLSGKLRCGVCGAPFRRITLSKGRAAWVCRNHNKSAEKCPVLNVKEDEVYAAYITLYNRLKKAESDILSSALRYMEQAYAMHEDIAQETALLNARIAETAKKLTRLISLSEKGALSDALLVKNRTPLERELYELRQEKRRLLAQDDPEDIRALRMLIRIMDAGPEVMADFNPLIFRNMVQSISVSQEDVLTFHLLGGLALKEQICRRTGR